MEVLRLSHFLVPLPYVGITQTGSEGLPLPGKWRGTLSPDELP